MSDRKFIKLTKQDSAFMLIDPEIIKFISPLGGKNPSLTRFHCCTTKMHWGLKGFEFVDGKSWDEFVLESPDEICVLMK